MMPPKRPAAAPAVLRGGRRRPAAAIEERPGEERLTPGDRFHRGETVELAQLPAGALHVGALLVFDDCSYFGGPCKCAGRFREICHVEGGSRLRMHITGTTHADLLAFATGTPDRIGEAHLCPPECKGEPHSPGLIHSRVVRLVPKSEERKVDWELNLETETVDELDELRRKKLALEQELAEKKKREEKEKGDRRSRSRRRKKKRTGKKKKARESRSGSSSKEEKSKKDKVRRKYGGRRIARKSLEALFGGTGLDPRSRIRSKVMRYARRKTRKKSSTSSSSGGTSSSGEEKSSEEAGDLLMDVNKIRCLHRFGPGVLTAMGVSRMKETVIELEGLWNEEDRSLPPVAMKYIRSTLQGKMSGGALKETMTLGTIIDLLMMGRVSEAADVGMQRLKSLERISQGSSWTSTEKLELVGSLSPHISTRGEMTAAVKEVKLDQSAKGSVLPYKGKGFSQESKGKKGKGEEKGKSKKGGEGDKGVRDKKDK